MIGVVGILLFLFVIGPIGLFVVGGLWSLVHGWAETEAADARAEGKPA